MKKVAAVLLTDTHLKKDNLDLVESIFVQACELCIERNCKTIVHAGDWFTNRIGQTLQTLLRLKKIFEIVNSYGIEILGIPGNHDKTDQDNESSYLDVFDGYKSFKLFRKEGHVVINGVLFGFIPYFTASYIGRLDKLKKQVSHFEQPKILITHISVNGVKNNDGTIVEDAISPKKFIGFDKVLIGHYHDESSLSKIVKYVGSAYQANYGETFVDKGFTVITTDGKLEFVPSKFKKYIKVKIDASDKTAIDNELEFHRDNDDNVRFIFVGKKTDIDSINLSRFTDLGIEPKFEVEEINKEILNADNTELTQIDSKMLTKHFLEYCKIENIDPKMRKAGLKYLKS